MKLPDKFPYEHIVNYDTNEVWVKYSNGIASIGLYDLMNFFYPSYNLKIVSKQKLETRKSQLAK